MSCACEWTLEEKRHLLLALRKYGASDLSSIQQEFPFRSITEIRAVLEIYSQKGRMKSNSLKRDDDEEGETTSPIDNWIDLLNSTDFKKSPCIDVISRALKYIALFEIKQDHPVDLRDCYLILSELCKGTAIKDLDGKTKFVFQECLARLAEMTERHQQDVESKQEFVRNIQYSDLESLQIKTYQSKKQLSRNVNPLRIPEPLLKIKEN